MCISILFMIWTWWYGSWCETISGYTRSLMKLLRWKRLTNTREKRSMKTPIPVLCREWVTYVSKRYNIKSSIVVKIAANGCRFDKSLKSNFVIWSFVKFATFSCIFFLKFKKYIAAKSCKFDFEYLLQLKDAEFTLKGHCSF